jgi:uncharacterized protein YjbJ (UPF0337 family)
VDANRNVAASGAVMDNRIEGKGHEIKGAIKEHVGEATGNRSQQVEGNLEKYAGKAQQMMDAISDRMRADESKD